MVIGGRDFIIPLKAIYTGIYIYCQLGDSMLPFPPFTFEAFENIEADSCWFSAPRSEVKSNKMSSETQKKPGPTFH